MKIDQKELYRKLGDRLREERKRKRLTQADVAAACGILRTTVNNIETGRQGSPFHVIYTICYKLKIPFTRIVPREEEVIVKEDSDRAIHIEDPMNLTKKSLGVNKIIEKFQAQKTNKARSNSKK